MQKSIPSFKKQFQCTTFLKTLMLLALLQLQFSSKILINAVENDDIYKFDFESRTYVKTEGKLNFLTGYWTLITNGILEFAPAEPTFLMFSSTDNSQFIYLEKDVRVLTFKIHPNDFWVQVGPSNKQTVRTKGRYSKNFTDFYNPEKNQQKDMDISMRFLLKMFNFNKSDTSEVESLKERLAQVNIIPYYELKSTNNSSNYQNQIGFFIEDDGKALMSWAKENNLLQENWQEMISDENHNTFKRNLIARLMMSMYFQNNNFIGLSQDSDEASKKFVKAHQMLLLESVLPKAQEVLNASAGLEEAFGKIIEYFTKMSGQVMEIFGSRKRYPFFNDLFRPRNDKIQFPTASVTLDAILKQRAEWRKKPMDDYTNDSMNFAISSIMRDNITPETDLRDLEEEAKKAFISIVETLFDNMAGYIPDLGKIKPKEQPQFMEFYENEKFKAENNMNNCADVIKELIQTIESKPLETEFDASRSDLFFESLAKYDFRTITNEMLQMFYVPFSMEEFENRVVSKMSEFPPIKNMGINFDAGNNAEALDVFKEMLYVAGSLDFKPSSFDSKVKSDAIRNILQWEDERRLLLV
jgi:hypothetical protein